MRRRYENTPQHIDKYAKKTNAEILTPISLAQEMIDKIPPSFWKEKRKVFEPTCGKGVFLALAYDKFKKAGLSKKTILTECLYFADINPINIHISSLMLDPKGEIKLNCYTGNTLQLDIEKEWGITSFDAVIGNPPYQSQNGTGDNKLYLDFTKYSINHLYKNGILLFITPTTIIDYIIEMNKNRNYVDEFYNIEYIALNTPKKYFTAVSSTFTYFMLKKEKYTGDTIIEHYKGQDIITLRKGMKLPKIPSKVDLGIINKICSTSPLDARSADTCYDVKKCTFPDKTQRIRKQHITKNIVLINKTKSHKYKIYDTINKTNPKGKYYYYDKLDSDAGKKRIIFSNKGYLSPFICESKDITYSDNFSYILYETNLLELMKSKIVDYLIYQYSKNGFDRINCIRMIKKVNLTDNIYQSFNLTKEEQKRINNTTK
ncbi:MAG: Eco57I restriction-modification methylase domain-containing protein [Promethearchaeota archaeon]|jgi:hypothetical protein